MGKKKGKKESLMTHLENSRCRKEMSSLEERAKAKAEATKELRRQNVSGNAYNTPTSTQQQFTAEYYSPAAGTEVSFGD